MGKGWGRARDRGRKHDGKLREIGDCFGLGMGEGEG